MRQFVTKRYETQEKTKYTHTHTPRRKGDVKQEKQIKSTNKAMN